MQTWNAHPIAARIFLPCSSVNAASAGSETNASSLRVTGCPGFPHKYSVRRE